MDQNSDQNQAPENNPHTTLVQPTENSGPVATQPTVPQSPVATGTSTETLSTHTNTLAIISLILAFFIAPAAIVTGIIALHEIKQKNEKGKGLAVAGIVIGAISTIIGVLLFILLPIFVNKTLETTSKGVETAVNSAQSIQKISDEDVAKVAEQFMVGLKNKDYNTSFRLFSPDLKNEVKDPSGLKALVEKGKSTPKSWESFGPVATSQTPNEEKSISMTVTFVGGSTGAASIELINVEGVWKIKSFSLQPLV